MSLPSGPKHGADVAKTLLGGHSAGTCVWQTRGTMQWCAERIEPAAQDGLMRGDRLEGSRETWHDWLVLPADLREWVPPDTLKSWVEQQVRERRQDSLGPSAPSSARAVEPPPSPLGLLAFAYAAAVFSSEEIAQACRPGSPFQPLCNRQLPFAQELRNFRRRNRGLLQDVLAGVFWLAVTHRFDLEAAWLSQELWQDLRVRAVERLDIARHMDALDE